MPKDLEEFLFRLLAAAILGLLLGLLAMVGIAVANAQSSGTVTELHLSLLWEPNPADEQIDHYNVYTSDVVTGPFALLGQTAGTNYDLGTVQAGAHFYYVTAVNLWTLESEPSTTVSTPPLASKTTGLQILKIQP